MEVDAIVNAANTELRMGGGVCGAIFRAAGAAEMQAACDPLAPIRTGEAVITPGFALPAKHVIHTAGPVYSRQHAAACEQLLRSAYLNSLRLAAEHNCESIAFPLISSGIYGYPKDEALQVAVAAIRDFLADQDMDVFLVVFDKESLVVSEQLLGEPANCIDEHSLPKAIMIDLDDTIITFDHGVDLVQCWRHAIRTHLAEVGDDAAGEMISAILEKANWYWSDPERHRVGRRDLVSARQEIISAALTKWDIRDPALAREIAATYGEERDSQVKLFPDAVTAIERFRSLGIKLALITNGSTEAQWNKIRRFNLTGLFDCILVEGDVGVGKPEAGIYRLALEKLGVSANEAWMIGDNFEWEIAAPQRLGIRGIWFDHKGAGVPANSTAQPYMVIRSWGDLLSRMPVNG